MGQYRFLRPVRGFRTFATAALALVISAVDASAAERRLNLPDYVAPCIFIVVH